MAKTRICKCGHASGYHQTKQNYDHTVKPKKYLGKDFLQCCMDNCTCEKFILAKEKFICYKKVKYYATN